jgi:hypothetical protein
MTSTIHFPTDHRIYPLTIRRKRRIHHRFLKLFPHFRRDPTHITEILSFRELRCRDPTPMDPRAKSKGQFDNSDRPILDGGRVEDQDARELDVAAVGDGD